MAFRLSGALALVLATPFATQALGQEDCPVPDTALLTEALPGEWRLHLGAGTRTEAAGPAEALAAVEEPVAASAVSSDAGMRLAAEEFGDLALYFAAPGQEAPLGVAMADGSHVFTDPVVTGGCDPTALPRLIGGGSAPGAEMALDLFAFSPNLYSGSLTYRQGETIWVRLVTLDRPETASPDEADGGGN